MTDSLNDLAQQWAKATDPDLRRELEDRILGQARDLGRRAALAMGLGKDQAQDIAQHVSMVVAERLNGGSQLPENLERYSWTAGQNKAIDGLRALKKWKGAKEILRVEVGGFDQSKPSTENIWLDAEERKRAVFALQEALERAPLNYKQVIRRHYLEGCPIDELAGEVYEEMRRDGKVVDTAPASVAAARKRARNLVDARLKRGREWLRENLDPQRGGGGVQ